jgi:hypothetical protein
LNQPPDVPAVSVDVPSIETVFEKISKRWKPQSGGAIAIEISAAFASFKSAYL